MLTNRLKEVSSSPRARKNPYPDELIKNMVGVINGKVRCTVGNTELPINREGNIFYLNPARSARYPH